MEADDHYWELVTLREEQERMERIIAESRIRHRAPVYEEAA